MPASSNSRSRRQDQGKPLGFYHWLFPVRLVWPVPFGPSFNLCVGAPLCVIERKGSKTKSTVQPRAVRSFAVVRFVWKCCSDALQSATAATKRYQKELQSEQRSNTDIDQRQDEWIERKFPTACRIWTAPPLALHPASFIYLQLFFPPPFLFLMRLIYRMIFCFLLQTRLVNISAHRVDFEWTSKGFCLLFPERERKRQREETSKKADVSISFVRHFFFSPYCAIFFPSLFILSAFVMSAWNPRERRCCYSLSHWCTFCLSWLEKSHVHRAWPFFLYFICYVFILFSPIQFSFICRWKPVTAEEDSTGTAGAMYAGRRCSTRSCYHG